MALRKELTDIGADAGPGTIQWHLGRRGQLARVPSEATIWRVLVRRGFVVPEPRKRPKSAMRRFEAPAPNVLWQIDATKWAVGDHGRHIEILNVLDDHSRVAVASLAVEVATCEQAWAAFSSGIATWGLPTGLLSDNGLAFTGRLQGYEVAFEIKAIGRMTPAERWRATPPAVNIGTALPAGRRAFPVTITDRGTVRIEECEIHVGLVYTGMHAFLMIDQTHAAVFIDGVLVRHLELDRTRNYQPSGRKRGGPRHQRPALG